MIIARFHFQVSSVILASGDFKNQGDTHSQGISRIQSANKITICRRDFALSLGDAPLFFYLSQSAPRGGWRLLISAREGAQAINPRNYLACRRTTWTPKSASRRRARRHCSVELKPITRLSVWIRRRASRIVPPASSRASLRLLIGPRIKVSPHALDTAMHSEGFNIRAEVISNALSACRPRNSY